MNARIKRWLRTQVLLAIRKLRKMELKLIGLNTTDPNYSSLSPIGNSRENQKYAEALDWALKNRKEKDIKNIALTGPYGSGKSTILKTYYNQYQGKDLKFLFISLATFKEEDLEQTDPPVVSSADGALPLVGEKKELLRLIETSILQQIFYHENDNKIPDSRFKKIRSFNFWTLLVYALLYSLFLISLYIYLKPDFLPKVFKDWIISDNIRDLIHYATVSIIAIGVFGIIFNSIRMIRSVTLQKLNFQNAEIGIGANQNKSILNHHIDEILYFFSVRPYNVVVIEDLDRFKQTEIFTKLREINLLLNNSKKTRRKDIVFIYAVRDELFTDKERTKFFDFIIPVIPVINSSNSAKILMAKRTDYNYKLSDNLIEDLSYYIDDMRLLHNITNEFYLYKELLDSSLTQDKLFAIITYKNKYPQQFALLSNNSGEIYEMIFSKNAEINVRTSTLNQQIDTLKSEINRLSELYIDNLEDLRKLYLAHLYPKLKQFKDFTFESTIIDTAEMTEEDNFEHLIQDRLQYQYYYYNSSAYRQDIATKMVETKFKDLEKLVDQERPYHQRAREIEELNSNKIAILRARIQEIEKEKERLRNEPVASIMQQNAVEAEPGKEIKLEEILIRNGYIAEDYPDYISLFHDGDISRTDYQFLLNLKNGNSMGMYYKLQKTDRVIKKINLLNFQTHLVLNFDLLDQLLKEPDAHPEALKRTLLVLKDGTNTSTKFIAAFVQRTPHLRLFLRRLANIWAGVWSHFQGYMEYDETMKKQFFMWLIMYLDNKELAAISKENDLVKIISNDPKFPQIIPDQHKIRDLLKVLSIKFQQLELRGTPSETLKYIFEHNHYALNAPMLGVMLKEFGKYDHVTFESSNYSAIKNGESKTLIDYVDSHINAYVESVYLKLDKNTKDDETTVLLLLNNPSLTLENKSKVIERMDAVVSSLADIKQKEVMGVLLLYRKIAAGWNNIRIYFLSEEKEISQDLIDYFDNAEISRIYGNMKIPSEGDHRTDYAVLSRRLAEVVDFQNDVFQQISSAISFWFSDLELSGHSYAQVEILVKTQVIRPNRETFDWLKAEHNPLHITLIETSTETMSKELENLELDEEDIEQILGSPKITTGFKMKMLAQVEESLVISNPKSLKALTGILDKNPDFKVSEALIDAALLEVGAPSEERIRILLARKTADAEFLTSFISTLGGDYKKISDKSKRPTFEINDLNGRFLKLLQDRGLISSFPEQKNEFKVYHKTK